RPEDDDEQQDRHGADAVRADAVDAVAISVPGTAAVRATVVAVDDANPGAAAANAACRPAAAGSGAVGLGVGAPALRPLGQAPAQPGRRLARRAEEPLAQPEHA